MAAQHSLGVTATTERSQPGGRGKARRVLLIGGEPRDVNLQKDLARAGDLHVLTAGTGAEGLRVARLQTPDTVVLRATLPDTLGADVCRQLREDPVTETIPVIMLADQSGKAGGPPLASETAVAVVPAEIDSTRLCSLVQMVLTTKLARRSHPRVDVEVGVDYTSDFGRGTARTLNISLGGVFVAAASPPELDAILDLCFALPGGEPIEVRGRVAWIRRPDDQHPYPAGMAVQFSSLSEEATAAIAAYVKSKLRQPSPPSKIPA